MVLGKEEPKTARNTDFKKAIAIGLDECMTALEESFYDLPDPHVWAYPLEGRHNITTIVMHALGNLDEYGLRCQGGKGVVEHEERFDMWAHSPQELRPMQADLPGVAEMAEKLHGLREAVFAVLDTTCEDDLLKARPGVQWFAERGRTRADAYMRTIMHANCHIRQIWMLRGVMGLTDTDGWPVQHWA